MPKRRNRKGSVCSCVRLNKDEREREAASLSRFAAVADRRRDTVRVKKRGTGGESASLRLLKGEDFSLLSQPIGQDGSEREIGAALGTCVQSG